MAAFIAGAALVATVLVITDSGSRPAQHTLAEKKAMINHIAQKAHNKFFSQALDTECPVAVKPNGMCPGAPAEYIEQDGCCYKSRVCTLPTDIWCSKAGGCQGPKRLPGSEAGVNYEQGWAKPQGCRACCEANGQECGQCE